MNKNIAAFIICLMVFSAILSACQSGETAMTCGNYSLSEGEFKYYLSTYKGKFATIYSDFDDSEKFYSSEIGNNGETAGEYLFNTVVNSVKMTLAANALFDEYGLELSDSVIQTVDDYIDDYIEEYAGGNKNSFNQTLGEYGINIKMLREAYLRDERTSALFVYLYGENGAIGITDENRFEYLEENYTRVRHIYVNNKYKYSVDDDGHRVYTKDGLFQTEELSNDELAAKEALIDAIDVSLAEGGDFEEIYAAMSEDKYYENGYYLTRSTDFISDVINSAFELEVGEYTKIESDFGVHYIMRLELDQKPWEDKANSDFFENYDETVASKLFSKFIEGKISEVECNDAVISNYSLIDSPTNYRF